MRFLLFFLFSFFMAGKFLFLFLFFSSFFTFQGNVFRSCSRLLASWPHANPTRDPPKFLSFFFFLLFLARFNRFLSQVFDRKIITKRTLREIKLLRQFQGHENITNVLDVFKMGDDETFNEIYVVQELMEADMHQIIRSRQKLTNSHFQYFLYQMLRGLKYIHSAGVSHLQKRKKKKKRMKGKRFFLFLFSFQSITHLRFAFFHSMKLFFFLLLFFPLGNRLFTVI